MDLEQGNRSGTLILGGVADDVKIWLVRGGTVAMTLAPRLSETVGGVA